MRLFAASLILLFTFVGPAMASPASEAYLNSVLTSIQSDGDRSDADVIVDQIDIIRVSRFVLGQHARRANTEDLEQFSLRFEIFLREFLSSRAEELSNATMTIIASSDRSSVDSVISTRVASATREPMTMRWRVMLKDDQWQLVDVEIHGLWLAIEQRAQIDSLLDAKKIPIGQLYLDSDGR